MEMQKEREALQKLINEMFEVTGTWSVADMVTHVWQAAKASAVPDGYCVVPKEPTYRMISAGDDVQAIPNEWVEVCDVYKAMIEAAQEQNQ